MTRKPNEIDSYVAQQVLAARHERGVSQERLAEACGITFQQQQKYERGTNRISAGRLHQIAEFLELPYSYFFPGKVGRPRAGLDVGNIVKEKKKMEGTLRRIRKLAGQFQ